METNELLYNLQKYDITIKNAEKELAFILHSREEIINGRAARNLEIINFENKLKEYILSISKYEKEAECVEMQIQKLTDRFLLIKTEKELSKYNVELEKLKTDKNAAEEKFLTVLDKQERLNAKIEKLKSNHVIKNNEDDDALSILEEKINAQNAEIEKLKEYRSRFITQIPLSAIELYEKLIISKNGLAVSLVSRKICSGCHLSISDNTLNQIKFKTALVCCPNCQRIIFIE